MDVCIIAGQGDLPKLLANKSKNSLVICIKGLSSSKDFRKPREELSITKIESIIDLLKKYKIKNIIFAGKFFRPETITKNLDSSGKLLLEAIRNKGDNELLENIKNFFSKYGFKILPPTILLKENIFYDDMIIAGDELQKDYIKKYSKHGLKLLNSLSKFDVGQATVLVGGHIIGIEGLEGTNQLIKRCGELYERFLKSKKSYGPILVKFPKQGQSLGLDMPVVGIDTVKLCFENNFLGLSVSSSGVLILDQNKIKKFCENNNFLFYTFGG